MKFVMKLMMLILIALVLGGGTAFYALSNPQIIKEGFIANGPWTTSLLFGNESSGIYSKAVVAKIGLFALNRKETIYFTAFTDSDGEPLQSTYRYRIEGGSLDTRWWSLTVYGEDNFLIPNKHKRYAYSMNNVEQKTDGSYTIGLSKTPQQGNWLPTGDLDQKLSLTLRLYNPPADIYKKLETIQLPRIIKETT